VLAKVVSVPGSIGYVEATLARKSGIGYGRVQNAAGHFVSATPDSIEAACAAMEHAIPDDLLVDMTNPPGVRSYPIVSFTWLYVPTSDSSPLRRDALKQLLNWALSDGQTIARRMGYAPLPEGILARSRQAVKVLP
jgi:phosphate transport system substrate-binding protein